MYELAARGKYELYWSRFSIVVISVEGHVNIGDD